MAEKDAESLTAHVMQSQPAAEKSPRRLPPKRDKREANSALSAEAWAHRNEAASVKLVNDRSASCTSSLLQPYSRPSVTDTTSARLFHGLKKLVLVVRLLCATEPHAWHLALEPQEQVLE